MLDCPKKKVFDENQTDKYLANLLPKGTPQRDYVEAISGSTTPWAIAKQILYAHKYIQYSTFLRSPRC